VRRRLKGRSDERLWDATIGELSIAEGAETRRLALWRTWERPESLLVGESDEEFPLWERQKQGH